MKETIQMVIEWFQKLWALLVYIFSTYWIKSIFWILIMSSIYYKFKHQQKLSDDWANVIDPTFTVFALIIPIILGFLFVYSDWEKSLENKLIVHFSIKKGNTKQFVLSCYNVNLLHGSDMRAIGQQIGSQMGQSQLKFNPSIKPISENVIKVKNEADKNEWIKYFEIEFLLDDEPSELFKKRNSYLVWNLFKEEKLVKEIKERPPRPFHEIFEDKISLFDLLSSNDASKAVYGSILNEADLIQNLDTFLYLVDSLSFLEESVFTIEKLSTSSLGKLVDSKLKKGLLINLLTEKKVEEAFEETFNITLPKREKLSNFKSVENALVFLPMNLSPSNNTIFKHETEILLLSKKAKHYV